LVPNDGKNVETTLLAFKIQAQPGQPVALQALSRKAPDQPWHLSEAVRLPTNHTLWEALLSAYETAASTPDTSTGA
jgi:hypothetical protein